jgi:hypothetical protein
LDLGSRSRFLSGAWRKALERPLPFCYLPLEALALSTP